MFNLMIIFMFILMFVSMCIFNVYFHVYDYFNVFDGNKLKIPQDSCWDFVGSY